MDQEPDSEPIGWNIYGAITSPDQQPAGFLDRDGVFHARDGSTWQWPGAAKSPPTGGLARFWRWYGRRAERLRRARG